MSDDSETSFGDQLETTFDHVHVYCTDLDASERFFVDVLGGQVAQRRGSHERPTVVVELGGGVVLLRGRLVGEELAPPGAPRFGTDHIGLKVADVRDAVELLRRRGADISVEPRELRPGVWVAFAVGPDEVRIELVQRPT